MIHIRKDYYLNIDSQYIDMRNRRDFILSSLIVQSSLVLPIIAGVFSHAIGRRYFNNRRYIYATIAISSLFKVMINIYVFYGMIMSNAVLSAFYSMLWPLLWLSVFAGVFIEYFVLSYLVNRFFFAKRLPNIS